MSIESVMASNHLILCHPFILLPSIFPSIMVFSSESALCIRLPKYWSFSLSISPSNEYSGLISFRIDWFDHLAVQETLKSLLQLHSSKHQFFGTQPSLWSNSYPYMTVGKTITLTIRSFAAKWCFCFLVLPLVLSRFVTNICWIIEKAREFQKNIYLCFINYTKAFYCVDHDKPWKALRWKYQTISPISWETCMHYQEATVRALYGTTNWLKIKKVVRQGCVWSPSLFNLYTEHIMRSAGLDELQARIEIGGRNINNLRDVDDTILMAESEEELKSLLMRVKEQSEKVGLRLNIKKIPWHPAPLIHADGRGKGGSSDRYPLLGLQIHCGWWLQPWTQKMIASWRKSRDKHRQCEEQDITLPTKIHIVKGMVFPVVT